MLRARFSELRWDGVGGDLGSEVRTFEVLAIYGVVASVLVYIIIFPRDQRR